MNEEIFFIRLRDCFTAGYTFPQFCIDNKIKKPLFVGLDERHAAFMWQVYVQFKYDKRITPSFTLLNGNSLTINHDYSITGDLPELQDKKLSDINFADYDRIIFLTTGRLNAEIPNAIYLDELWWYFHARTYVEIPLLHFMQRHPRVKLIMTGLPPQKLGDDAEFNKNLLSLSELREKISASGNKHFPNHFDKLGYSNADVLKLTSTEATTTNFDGSTSLDDDDDPLVGVKGGRRMTAYQPENYVNKIYIVGNCVFYGINAPFDKTIASYLQKMLSENNLPYRVENEGQTYFKRRQDTFYNLVKLNLKPNDIIIFFGCPVAGIPFFDVSRAFDSYDYRTIWFESGHPNEVGYKILAENFFQMLTQNNFFKDVDFHYPPPCQLRTATAFRVKIPHQRQNFSTWKSWKPINKNFVNGDLKLGFSQ